jgi:hypothetical protein
MGTNPRFELHIIRRFGDVRAEGTAIEAQSLDDFTIRAAFAAAVPVGQFSECGES